MTKRGGRRIWETDCPARRPSPHSYLCDQLGDVWLFRDYVLAVQEYCSSWRPGAPEGALALVPERWKKEQKHGMANKRLLHNPRVPSPPLTPLPTLTISCNLRVSRSTPSPHGTAGGGTRARASRRGAPEAVRTAASGTPPSGIGTWTRRWRDRPVKEVGYGRTLYARCTRTVQHSDPLN